ncbi:hypothetical protein VTO42DRAFT_2623 [Malbranchea cinnamomea]
MAHNHNLSESTLGGDDPIFAPAVPQNESSRSFYRLRQVASKTVVSFGPQDPEDPRNWSWFKKLFILVSAVMNVLNSTLGSSLPSGAISFIAKDFKIDSKEQLVLPISLFLVGYVCGPLLCGPLSEFYGRRPVLIICFFCFTVFTLGCAVAKSWEAFLVLRFLVGVVASAPIAISGGLLADIHDEPVKRGHAMAYQMTATTVGPIVGPAISGFVSVVSWRWTFWIALIFAGATLPLVLLTPETYEPVLLQKRARKLRKESGNNSIVAPVELEKRSIQEIITVTLTRPIRMIIQESIVLNSCLYLSLVYAIFFLYFQTYPAIFKDIYGMSDGVAGLMFLPIGLGSLIACIIFLWWDSYLHRARERGAKWTHVEEYRRLPLACIAGPMFVVSLFWIGWTAQPHIHWAVPMLSGILFGTGYMLIFIAILNYLTDAYETYSASAQAAASCSRSLFGAALPIASSHMLSTLGVAWASSLLAFLCLALSIIPFAFIKFGERIRAGSKFCQHLRQLKEQRRREEEADGRLPINSLTLPSAHHPDEEKWEVPNNRNRILE